MKKFTVALVVSGIVEAESLSDAREKLECTLGIFDFVDSLSSTMKITDGNETAEIAELLKTDKIADRFFVVCIDKNHVCPVGPAEAQGLDEISEDECPYISTFGCHYAGTKKLEETLKRDPILTCPFDPQY